MLEPGESVYLTQFLRLDPIPEAVTALVENIHARYRQAGFAKPLSREELFAIALFTGAVQAPLLPLPSTAGAAVSVVAEVVQPTNGQTPTLEKFKKGDRVNYYSKKDLAWYAGIYKGGKNGKFRVENEAGTIITTLTVATYDESKLGKIEDKPVNIVRGVPEPAVIIQRDQHSEPASWG